MPQLPKLGRSIRTIVVAAAVATVVGSSFAVASSLITSKDIQNGTIKPADLNRKLRKKLDQRTTAAAQIPGQQGANGAKGPEGKAGPAGTPAAVGLTTWGPMLRNEFGSPVAETGTTATGTNALILATADGTEKAEYGTETEFAGLKISSISSIGFTAYVTDGDVSFSSTANQPNIQMEVNPKVASKTYSSLVYNPKPIVAAESNTWRAINAAAAVTNHGEEGWYFSNGTVATTTNCTQAHLCSLTEVKAAAPEAEVSLSVGLGKGRDSQFQGAISEFHINATSYTFGPGGTFKK